MSRRLRQLQAGRTAEPDDVPRRPSSRWREGTLFGHREPDAAQALGESRVGSGQTIPPGPPPGRSARHCGAEADNYDEPVIRGAGGEAFGAIVDVQEDGVVDLPPGCADNGTTSASWIWTRGSDRLSPNSVASGTRAPGDDRRDEFDHVDMGAWAERRRAARGVKPIPAGR